MIVIIAVILLTAIRYALTEYVREYYPEYKLLLVISYYSILFLVGYLLYINYN